MRLLTFEPGSGGTSRAGALRDERVIDLSALAAAAEQRLPDDVLEFARDEEQVTLARRLLDGPVADDVIHPVGDVHLRAPLRPGKIVGVGLNYVEHVEESARTLDTAKELPERPVLFSKPATAVVGPGEPILHNAALTQQLDWECELAVVIGKRAKGVSQDDALEHVFGYSIVNDISARDQRRSGQWFYSKGQDSFAPFGPWIVTADEIDDPQNLDLSLKVNGELMQSSNTRFMLFAIAELIADISAGMTLEPGDVIATGSPSGVGAAQDPPRFLSPGDVLELEIERIGQLTNPVAAVS